MQVFHSSSLNVEFRIMFNERVYCEKCINPNKGMGIQTVDDSSDEETASPDAPIVTRERSNTYAGSEQTKNPDSPRTRSNTFTALV